MKTPQDKALEIMERLFQIGRRMGQRLVIVHLVLDDDPRTGGLGEIVEFLHGCRRLWLVEIAFRIGVHVARLAGMEKVAAQEQRRRLLETHQERAMGWRMSLGRNDNDRT